MLFNVLKGDEIYSNGQIEHPGHKYYTSWQNFLKHKILNSHKCSNLMGKKKQIKSKHKSSLLI